MIPVDFVQLVIDYVIHFLLLLIDVLTDSIYQIIDPIYLCCSAD